MFIMLNTLMFILILLKKNHLWVLLKIKFERNITVDYFFLRQYFYTLYYPYT